MTKERQMRRKRHALAQGRTRPSGAPAESAASILRGPLGRLLADEFFGSHPALSTRWADNPERRYETFSRLVEAKFLRLTLEGGRLGIQLDPEVGAAIEQFAGTERDPDVIAQRFEAARQEALGAKVSDAPSPAGTSGE